MKKFISTKTLTVLTIILLTILTALSLLWNIHEENSHIFSLAKIEADAAYSKDLAYRRWAAEHGGTYVEVTANTPPNPFLAHIKERDISTSNGKKLTLINPAYMTRQVHEIAKDEFGVKGHITSLRPLRPANAPDAWEKMALTSFENGSSEMTEIVTSPSGDYLRYMRPVITEQGCLKCHESQGYKLGDIRGGISVSVPLHKHQLVSAQGVKIVAISHLVLWALMIIAALIISNLYTKGEKAREQASAQAIENMREKNNIQSLMLQTEKMISLGGLAAGMAHEINNPLGIITQAAQNIERRFSPEMTANLAIAKEVGTDLEKISAYCKRREIDTFIADIKTAVARASRIIHSMLQFSRNSKDTKIAITLDTLIEQSIELAANDYSLKKKYDFKAIKIVREFANDLPAIPIIFGEMEQVFLNLLKNAAQAMHTNPSTRPPQITLRLKKDGNAILIEIEDNGQGMEPKVLKRIFEPFFTTKSPNEGTGLGLAVTHRIITLNHSGTIDVTSTLGHGSCFSIRLPCN